MRSPNAAASVVNCVVDYIAKEDFTAVSTTHNCVYNGDPVSRTVNCDARSSIISEEVRSRACSGRTSGCFGDQTVWRNNLEDWFVIVGITDDLNLD